MDNPCEGMITDGWKNCSRCQYVNEITLNYVCFKEVEYQGYLTGLAEGEAKERIASYDKIMEAKKSGFDEGIIQERERIARIIHEQIEDLESDISNPHFEQATIVRFAGMKASLKELAAELKELE